MGESRGLVYRQRQGIFNYFEKYAQDDFLKDYSICN